MKEKHNQTYRTCYNIVVVLFDCRRPLSKIPNNIFTAQPNLFHAHQQSQFHHLRSMHLYDCNFLFILPFGIEPLFLFLFRSFSMVVDLFLAVMVHFSYHELVKASVLEIMCCRCNNENGKPTNNNNVYLGIFLM